MSPQNGAAARGKLALVADNIGYPAKLPDDSWLVVARNDECGNAERATAFMAARRERKIGKPVDRGEWEMTAPTMNAFYDPHRSSVNFPVGILQPPYFESAQELVREYAAGVSAGAGADGPACARAVPGQRSGPEHAVLCGSVRVQSGRADGA